MKSRAFYLSSNTFFPKEIEKTNEFYFSYQIK